jgi:hypothetical protein
MNLKKAHDEVGFPVLNVAMRADWFYRDASMEMERLCPNYTSWTNGRKEIDFTQFDTFG